LLIEILLHPSPDISITIDPDFSDFNNILGPEPSAPPFIMIVGSPDELYNTNLVSFVVSID
jgi:hypothetical protein